MNRFRAPPVGLSTRKGSFRAAFEPLEPRTLASANPWVDLATNTVYAPRADGTVEVTRWIAGTIAPPSLTLDAQSFDVWFRHVGITTDKGPAEGDFDFSRVVDAADFDVWFRAVGQPVSAPPPLLPAPAPAYDWHRETIDGKLHVWAPDPGDFGQTYTVPATSANWSQWLYGDNGKPDLESIAQGPAADCYFLAAAGSIAYRNPAHIQTLIGFDGYGFTCEFQDVNTRQLIVIHTAATFSNYWFPPHSEGWSLVMEKAFAAFRTWNGVSSLNTVASIGWGFGSTALLQLQRGVQQPAFTDAALTDAIDAAKPLLVHTTAFAPTMVPSHVYVITSVSTDAHGTRWVTTYNPWGFFDTRTEQELLANSNGSLVRGTA